MNTMSFYLWLLPVLFMVHEFEEIFMIEPWFSRYKDKIRATWPKTMPFGLNHAGPYLTVSIAIGIFVQYIFVILICALCAIFQNYYAWYGFFVGMVLHMIYLHLRDFIKFKGYTPGIVTCAVTFIPCVVVLYQANTLLHYGILEIVLSFVVMEGLGYLLVFRFLHKSVALMAKRLFAYSQSETKEMPSSNALG